MEHQTGVILTGVVAKYQFATVPVTSPMGFSSEIFVDKLQFLLFYYTTHWENLLKVINQI